MTCSLERHFHDHGAAHPQEFSAWFKRGFGKGPLGHVIVFAACQEHVLAFEQV